MMQNRQQLTRRAFLGTAGLVLADALVGCDSRRAEFGGPQLKPREVGATGPRTLDDIRVSGTLKVGILSDNRPLAGINGDGVYGGIDDYYCLYVTEVTKLGVEYVAVDPHDRYDRLLSGEIDVCVSEMSPADDRADEVAFVHPLYRLELALVSPKTATITTLDELGQGPVAVCAGSYAEQYARTEWPAVELRTYPSYSAARSALEAGQVVALLDQEIPAVWWIKEHGSYTLGMKGIGEPRYLAPAVAAGNDTLLEELNNIAEGFIRSKWLARAYEFVVKKDIGEDYVTMLCKIEDTL